jgi:hypothetical protein
VGLESLHFLRAKKNHNPKGDGDGAENDTNRAAEKVHGELRTCIASWESWEYRHAEDAEEYRHDLKHNAEYGRNHKSGGGPVYLFAWCWHAGHHTGKSGGRKAYSRWVLETGTTQ